MCQNLHARKCIFDNTKRAEILLNLQKSRRWCFVLKLCCGETLCSSLSGFAAQNRGIWDKMTACNLSNMKNYPSKCAKTALRRQCVANHEAMFEFRLCFLRLRCSPLLGMENIFQSLDDLWSHTWSTNLSPLACGIFRKRIGKYVWKAKLYT